MRFVGPAGSVALLIVMAVLVDFDQLLHDTATADPVALGIASAAYLGAILLRGVRLAVLLSAECESPVLATSMRIACVATFANHVLPVKAGDLATAVLPRLTSKVPLAVGMTTLLVSRLHDIVAIALLGILSLLPLSPLGGPGSLLLLALLAPALAAGFVPGPLVAVFHQMVSRILPARYLGRLGQALTDFAGGMRGAVVLRRPGALALSLVLSLAAWGLVTAFLYLLLRASSLDLPPHLVFLGNLGTTASQALPISFLGNLGIYEAGWVFGFVAVGLTVEQAAATALLSHITAILVSGVAAVVAALGLGGHLYELWREVRS